MQLEQIRNAIIDTCYIGVIEAYLRSKQFQTAFSKRYGFNGVGATRLRTMLAEETDIYAAVQKNDHGFDILDSRLKRQMSVSGVTPDLWILPQGVKIYLALARPENTVYALKGPDGQEVYKSALNGQNGVFMDAQNNCKIVETKSFELPGNSRDVYDPLFRNVSVGEYNVMIDTVSKYLPPTQTYVSSMRDIFVYNEDRDNFSRISIKAALDHCNRFSHTGGLWWPSLDFPRDPDVSDMFVTEDENGNQGPVEYFGDMAEEYLSMDTIEMVVQSVLKKYNAPTPVQLATLFPGSVGLNANGGPNSLDNRALKWGKREIVALFSEALGLEDQDQLFNDRVEKFAVKLESVPNAIYINDIVNFFRFIVTYGIFIRSPSCFDLTDTPYDEQHVYAVNAITLVLEKFVDDATKAAAAANADAGAQAAAAAAAAAANGIKTAAGTMIAPRGPCQKLRAILGNPAQPKKVVFYQKYDNIPDVPEVPAGAYAAPWTAEQVGIADYSTEEGRVANQVETMIRTTLKASGLPNQANGVPNPAPMYTFGAGIFGTGDEEEETHYGAEPASKQLFGAARRQTIATDAAGAVAVAKNNRSTTFITDLDKPKKRVTLSMKVRLDELQSRYPPTPEVPAAGEVLGIPEQRDIRELIAWALIGLKVEKKSFQALIDNDIAFPFSFLLMRPYITHRMGTAILTKSGAETGETLIGHADFQLGDNVAQKMHYGNYTMYLKSIVYKADNVSLAENIYAAGYVRGNGIQMHSLASSSSKPNWKSGNESIYCCMIPYIADGDSYDATFHSEIPNPMDSTGKFSNNAPQLVALDNAVRYLRFQRWQVTLTCFAGWEQTSLCNFVRSQSAYHSIFHLTPNAATSTPASINVRF